MKTIRDNKWFEILKKGGTLQDIIDSEPWQSQSYIQGQFSLAGGLDRTKTTKKGFSPFMLIERSQILHSM